MRQRQFSAAISAKLMLSWLAIISHLARHNLERARNSLMRADKPPQKCQNVDDDGYDANDIDQYK